MPGPFTIEPVDVSFTLSNEGTAQLLREVLAVAETSELIEPSHGDVYVSDPDAAAGMVAYVTPPAAPKRRVSRSVCVPIRSSSDSGAIIPGVPREAGESALPARAAMYAALARATGARFIAHTASGWILDHQVFVSQETEVGTSHEADVIISAIEKTCGVTGRGAFRGVVKLVGNGYFLFLQEPREELLNEYATVRLAVQEHFERLGFDVPRETRYAAMWRGDGRMAGMVALHEDGSVSPYVLSDFRGGVGMELAQILWDRKRAVSTPAGSDVERFYREWGFAPHDVSSPEARLTRLLSPTVHGNFQSTVAAVLIAPRALKVLMGLRAPETRVFPGHWDFGTSFADGRGAVTIDETLASQGVSMAHGLAPRLFIEHFCAYENAIFKVAAAFFVLDAEREERYLCREWFPRTDEYVRLSWVDIGSAYTRRPTSLATRALLRRAMWYMKQVSR